MKRRLLALAVIFVFGLCLAAPAAAERYDPKKEGQPLRVIAYVGHHVGVLLDMLIMRPAHWIGSHSSFTPVRSCASFRPRMQRTNRTSSSSLWTTSDGASRASTAGGSFVVRRRRELTSLPRKAFA